MSNSVECWDFSGRRLPEKPSFSQTCTRLSRYLKEKGSFGDLSLGMTCKPDLNGGFGVTRLPKMMNLFPCEALATETTETTETKYQSAPLTIFYGGQVMVFDDFPAEKAKEVIDLANKGSVKSVNNNQNLAKNQAEIASSSTLDPAKTAEQEPVQPNTSSLACELPIARRASLHRFLEKRKDRITSKAPYQIDGATEASSKANKDWLGSQ